MLVRSILLNDDIKNITLNNDWWKLVESAADRSMDDILKRNVTDEWILTKIWIQL
jgi:hypothetical protein